MGRYEKQYIEPSQLSRIGDTCRRYRKYILKMTVRDVAEKLGYSPNSIYSFEAGYVNNAIILLWYMSRGLTYDMITKGVIRNGEG